MKTLPTAAIFLLFLLLQPIRAEAVEFESWCTYVGVVETASPLEVRVRSMTWRGNGGCAKEGALVSPAWPSGRGGHASRPDVHIGFSPHEGDVVSIRWHNHSSSWVAGENVWRVTLMFPSVTRPLAQRAAMGLVSIALLMLLWRRHRRARLVNP